jgi:hypothetical protein
VIILDTRENSYFVGGYLSKGKELWVERKSTQFDAVPTTPDEAELLKSGHCPKCHGVLQGSSGKFCIPDQIEWKENKGEGS